MNYSAHLSADPLNTIETEYDLLGILMRQNELVEAIADMIAPDDFSEPLLGRIFGYIVAEVMQGKAANPVTLRGYLEGDTDFQSLGGIQYLGQMTGNVSLMSAYDAAKHLADVARRRHMRDDLRAASDACADVAVPISEIVGQADNAISTKTADSIHQPTGAECFEELVHSFDEAQLGVICQQIPALDELHGPMKPKQLIIMAGRPGMGKTAVALSYAIGAAEGGHGVLFVSLEMSSRELAARMAADMCFTGTDGVPYAAIRDGKPNDYQRRKVVEAGTYMAKLPLNVIDAGHLSVGRLNMLVRRHARRMEAQGFPLELVVVDYLQLLSPNTKGRSAYEAVSEVSRELKAIAKDNDVAILALAQLSRSVEKRDDKRPQLSDLRDSGQIEQDADSVIFLLRQEYYLRQEEPEPGTAERIGWETAMETVRGQIEFITAKRRDGVTGNAFGQFHGAYQAVR